MAHEPLPADIQGLIDAGRWGELWQPMPEAVVLNHGSYGRTFRHVREAHVAIEVANDTDPAAFWRHSHHERVEAAAAEIGDFLGVGADRGVAFAHNASTATVEAIAAFAVPGRPVVGTSLGYGGIRYGLNGLAKRLDCPYIEVDFDSIAQTSEIEAKVIDAVTEHRPAVLVLDHISSATALRLPVESIVSAVRTASPDTRIVIDGAHAAGMEPDPVVDGADAWAGNLHKWVSASTGAAVLIAKRDSDLKPVLRSWTSDEPFPQSFTWLGTDDKAAYLTAPLAARIIEALREAGLDKHNRTTANSAGDLLAEAWGVAPDPRPAGMEAPWMRLVEVPLKRALAQEELNGAILKLRNELKADVILTQFKGSTFVRLSAHGYNDISQYERLVAIPEVLADY